MKYKSKILNGHIRLIGYVLILIQSICLVLFATAMLGNRYQDDWNTYLTSATNHNFYLNNVSSKKTSQFIDYTSRITRQHHLLILRKDNQNYADDQNNLNIGMIGNSENKNVDFAYLNHNIINQNDVNKLLNDSNQNATLGLGKGSINQIKNIYQFPFSDPVTIYQLGTLIKQSNTINGNYEIVGIHNNAEYNQIIKQISEITGQKQSNLKTPKVGMALENSLAIPILMVAIIVCFLALLSLFLIMFVQSSKRIGTLILLGWSKSEILFKFLSPFLMFNFLCLLILSLLGALIIDYGAFFMTLLQFYIFINIVNIIMTLIAFILSSFVMILIKNIDLIKGKFSKKVLYTFAMSLYVFISIGVVVVSYITDRPMDSIINNQQIARNWSNVSQMNVLSKIENNGDIQSNQLDQNIYNFYKSISDHNGVYIINTSYLSEHWINNMKNAGTYKSLPNRPFWQFDFSPNYAQKVGIKLTADELQAAKQGQRLYLIPDSLSNQDFKADTNFLKEDALLDIGGNDVQTPFLKQKKFKFVKYKFNSDHSFFTWDDSGKNVDSTSQPVIMIATPANMTYVEIGGLYANGLDGYLKFDNQKIMKQNINNNNLKKYNLINDHLQFASVKQYIDGLQKDLMQTLQLFLVVFAILIMLLVILLLIIITVFNTANEKKIAVKKFLGFSFFNLYRLPLIVVALTTLLQLLAVTIMKSRIGFVLILISFIIQILVFISYVNRNQFKQIIKLFKGK
ncbi:hypothetical protein WR164_03010 [Philodulcilactobacillus myokoensis]|uniref:Uncharacterized protein n=1 Tax=Philodulcilactobacillus myokoensis TaxID=2929573 RepID=A0A9W6AZJ7_9LACO|nr:hypothetical protein [Philodulcilactobacillus myokoensis]GLB46322.1 hypothetical protein WR164_03010 [Philodulcilactobacillus myokoensis]